MKLKIVAAFVAVFAMFGTGAALAAETTAVSAEGLTLTGILTFFAVIWPHVVAILPVSWKDKIPGPVLWLMDKLAANYGSAKNEHQPVRAGRRR